MSVAADAAYCQELLRRGSKSFSAASRALPARVRSAATSLYAFCRVADDAVDDAKGAAAKLAAEGLSRRLERVYAGRGLDGPVERAFAALVERYPIPRALPEALVEGMRWDAEGRAVETESDLVAYSARVAASVGTMMSVVMGVRDGDVLARACDLGVAMQLTNIARDVGEDARMGRVYVPHSWLAEVGLEPDELRALRAPTEASRELVRRLLARADELYLRSEPGITQLPPDCRIAIGAARLIYADIGREIARAEMDSITRRAVVSTPRKLWLFARSLSFRFATPRSTEGPALAETRFLVDAVTAAAVPASGGARLAEALS